MPSRTSFLLLAALFSLPARAEIRERPKPAIATEAGDRIEFHLAMQLRWDYSYFDKGGESGTTNKIFFRRVRPVLSGSFWEERLSFNLHLNLVPGAAELMDLWLGVRLHPQLQTQFGQMKIPFTRHRLNSFMDQPFVDWSHETIYFGAERQVGLMLHNGMKRPPAWEYQLGWFGGVNARASNGIAPALVYGTELHSPSLLVEPSQKLFSQMHSELVLHLARNLGGIDTGVPTDFQGGPLRASFGLSAAWDLDPRVGEDMRFRLAPEVEARAYGFSASAVFYLGLFDLARSSGEYRPGMLGGLLRASYFFGDRFELALRYAMVAVLEDLRIDARADADARIAAAAEEDRAALEERLANVGKTLRRHELTAGFDWYFAGQLAKLVVDAGLRCDEYAAAERWEAVLRTQLQLSF